jgi:hypothetical protein
VLSFHRRKSSLSACQRIALYIVNSSLASGLADHTSVEQNIKRRNSQIFF